MLARLLVVCTRYSTIVQYYVILDVVRVAKVVKVVKLQSCKVVGRAIYVSSCRLVNFSR